MLEVLLRDLRQPEYVHALLNPVPIYGLGAGLIALVVALLLRSRPAQIAALVVLLLSAASIWPVMAFGERAYDNILTMSDADGRAWLEAHEERAEKLAYVYYALAAVSLASIFAPRWWPKTALPLTLLALVLGLGSLGAGAAIGYAGGKIRHREFRTVPPPPHHSPSAASRE